MHAQTGHTRDGVGARRAKHHQSVISSPRASLLAATALIFALASVVHGARLEGENARFARERLKDIRKSWPTLTKAEKLPLLLELSNLSESSVGSFLLEQTGKEPDADLAGEAARALARHGEKSDARNLLKLCQTAKEPARKAASVRWLGKYGEDAPAAELLQIALSADPWAEAAALALNDTGLPRARDWLDRVAQESKSMDARRAACACLIAQGDANGVRGLSNLDTLERAAQAAHAAAGTGIEVQVVERMIELARRPQKFAPGVRPHNFASFLGRLRNPESHQKLVDAAPGIHRSVEVEVSWWLIGWCKAATALKVARPALEDDDKDRVISGLRYLQNAPEPLKGDDLIAASDLVARHLASNDEALMAHALLACAACGIISPTVEGMMANWVKDAERPQRRAAGLLAIARSASGGNLAACLGALEDKTWYVVSAALEALRVLRPAGGLRTILNLAKKEQGGRVFAEAIALLRDLTGEDFGDELAKWEEWIGNNSTGFKPAAPRFKTLRGVPVTRLKSRTAARFFDLEFESENVEFTLDRSISMIDAMRREPARPDFAVRKADVLKRRPEVKRMMRDGFLPRFHAACIELGACLDVKEQRTQFGLTLFNTGLERYADKRTLNGPAERRAAVSWMLSSEVKGGTDIQAALLAVINKAEADTILLLSDGEPLSLGIIEQIQRANTFTRLDIHIVNLAKTPYSRHYLDVVALGAAGKLVDAEPMAAR